MTNITFGEIILFPLLVGKYLRLWTLCVSAKSIYRIGRFYVYDSDPGRNKIVLMGFDHWPNRIYLYSVIAFAANTKITETPADEAANAFDIIFHMF